MKVRSAFSVFLELLWPLSSPPSYRNSQPHRSLYESLLGMAGVIHRRYPARPRPSAAFALSSSSIADGITITISHGNFPAVPETQGFPKSFVIELRGFVRISVSNFARRMA